ncbi:PLP-dependent aminotransferase family protein [Pseudomonas sp. EYE_354]|uniref:aminotransferase-like domain-containing protein n=1 Tax=Pseudomonas sp. EYE_354 TaxID=2853449 RepID=UPI002005A337|nr:PLP-dependent aminotransferase family protein [Pseudomonas sp. EYE_354]MCK6190235.1 PLP-dependent aminotransferase family protein [Pseudomonas sp. EYE_354]
MTMPRYKTIADQVAENIRNGRLRPGTQLPTVRTLMREHGIALATAARVYRTLESMGLVVGEMGRGTFVRDTSLPRDLGLQPAYGAGLIDLTFNNPAVPGQAEMLRQALRNLASSGDLDALLHNAPHGGRPHERETAAKHLRNRGIRVPGSQVLIVNGAQQGLAMAMMALLKPGEVLAVDALTYPGIKALAVAHCIELLPIPLADGKTNLDALATSCKQRPVRAFYTMPTLHNPLGSIMPAADRKRLIALAEEHDFALIEDGGYAFLAEPAPKPLFTLAPHRTIYVSGLSKSVASGLRIGFIAAPVSLIPALEQAVRASTWSSPSITVELACRWIEEGVVDDLEELKRKDAANRQRIARRIFGGINLVGHPNAYFLWLPLPEDIRAESVAAALRRDNIMVTTAEPFSAASNVPNALRVALGSIPVETLKLALTKVRVACGY